METVVEVHSVHRTTQRQTNKKPLEKIDTTRLEHLTHVFHQVKSQLHARLVTSVLDIVKKNDKFRRMTNQCFEHIPIMALCMGKLEMDISKEISCLNRFEYIRT